jgi:hypothetical protein
VISVCFWGQRDGKEYGTLTMPFVPSVEDTVYLEMDEDVLICGEVASVLWIVDLKKGNSDYSVTVYLKNVEEK